MIKTYDKVMRTKISAMLSCLMLIALAGGAQDNQIAIQECYRLAQKNYPMVKQYQLIDKTTAFTLSNASKGYYPKIGLKGKVSYQSAVTQIPIDFPGIAIPSLSKDQYNIYAEITQVLYDGGLIKQQKKQIEAQSAVQKRELETNLYALNKRVNQLFFGVLVLKRQLQQNELLQNTIQLGVGRIDAAIANGTALKIGKKRLQAELLQTNQQRIQLEAALKAYSKMLGLLIGKEIDDNTILKRPESVSLSAKISRPQLALFESEKAQLAVQNKLIRSKNLPNLSFFLQGGYGRPALNFLSDEFDPYYIGGLRLSFPLSGFYTTKKEKQIIHVKQQQIDVQKETFLFNTNLKLTEQVTEIQKYQELVATDTSIVKLRQQIKNTTAQQLDYGTATANDYLKEVNAWNAAQEAKILHQLQLLKAQYEYLWESGQLKIINTNK